MNYTKLAPSVLSDDFESGDAGWTHRMWNRMVSGARINSFAHSGSHSIKHVIGSSSDAQSTRDGSYKDFSGFVAGETYLFSVWVYAAHPEHCKVLLLDIGGGAGVQRFAIEAPGAAANSWTYVELLWTATSSRDLRVHLIVGESDPHAMSAATQQDSIYWDDLRLVPARCAAWAPPLRTVSIHVSADDSIENLVVDCPSQGGLTMFNKPSSWVAVSSERVPIPVTMAAFPGNCTMRLKVNDAAVAGGLMAAVLLDDGAKLSLTNGASGWVHIDADYSPPWWGWAAADISNWSPVGECTYRHTSGNCQWLDDCSPYQGFWKLQELGAKLIWTAPDACSAGPEGDVYFSTSFTVPGASTPPVWYSPPPSSPILDVPIDELVIDTLDLSNGGAQPELAGYSAGCLSPDKRHGFFAPFQATTSDSPTTPVPHGHFVRVDLFDWSQSGITTLDLEAIDANLVGFISVCVDATHVYLPPYLHSHLARVPLSNFTEAAVEFTDLSIRDARLYGYSHGVVYGGWLYLTPYGHGPSYTFHGVVTRVPVGHFHYSFAEFFDLTQGSATSPLRGFGWGAIDGTYLYMSPLYNALEAGGGTPGAHGWVTRVSLADFQMSAVTSFDLTTIHSGLRGYVGATYVNGYIYLSPHYDGTVKHGRIVRIYAADFSPTGVEWFDMATINNDLRSFIGMFSDGSHMYMPPFKKGHAVTDYHGLLTRLRLDDFSTSGLAWRDLTTATSPTDAGLTGFRGGFEDGVYGYLVPLSNSPTTYTSKIVRFSLHGPVYETQPVDPPEL